MSDLIWLSDRQFAKMRPYFPLVHGAPRVDDRLIISGIINVIRNNLRWRDAPADYHLPKRNSVTIQQNSSFFASRCRHLPK